jgi:hypothetical protein
MRTALRIALLVAIVATLFSPARSVAAPADCATNWFEVYKITMKTDREVYELGDRALVTMKVTEASTGTPVADADVAAGAVVADYYYTNRVSRTNDEGIAKLSLNLDRRYLKAGWADLRGMARTYYDEGEAACAGIGFYGFKEIPKAFRIRG